MECQPRDPFARWVQRLGASAATRFSRVLSTAPTACRMVCFNRALRCFEMGAAMITWNNTINCEVWASDGCKIASVNTKANAIKVALVPELIEALNSLVEMHNDQIFICGADEQAVADKTLANARKILSKL